MATTPCPHCGAAVPVPDGDEGTCPACKRALRFIEVPERACVCGATVPIPPDAEVVTCSCGKVLPADPRRGILHVAHCPRCRRRIDVDAEASSWTCPHCHAQMTLQDTF